MIPLQAWAVVKGRSTGVVVGFLEETVWSPSHQTHHSKQGSGMGVLVILDEFHGTSTVS